MANMSINLVFHHGSILSREPVRPVTLRPCASFHLFSATWAVTSTSKAYHVSPVRWKRLVRRCSISDFVIASDENYGNKQVVSLTPRLYDYVLKNVREPEILRQLREETASMRGSQMQVSPDQAQLLTMLVQILGAERCIEVGVYTVWLLITSHSISPTRIRLLSCL